MWIYSCDPAKNDWQFCGICSKCIENALHFAEDDYYRDLYGSPVDYYVDGWELARSLDGSWDAEDRKYWTDDDWAEYNTRGRKLNSKKWKHEPVFTLMDLEEYY